MLDLIHKRFDEALAVIAGCKESLAPRLAQAAAMIVASSRAGGGAFIFGNGGSAADAQHIAGELVGRFLKNRRPYRAQALTTDTSILTAVGNDFGFDTIFVRQLQAAARPGDVAIALSTSGNSANVTAALEHARKNAIKTIAFTGQGGGQCAQLADVLLSAPAELSPRIQEAHAVMYHILCELVEQALAEG